MSSISDTKYINNKKNIFPFLINNNLKKLYKNKSHHMSMKKQTILNILHIKNKISTNYILNLKLTTILKNAQPIQIFFRTLAKDFEPVVWFIVFNCRLYLFFSAISWKIKEFIRQISRYNKINHEMFTFVFSLFQYATIGIFL